MSVRNKRQIRSIQVVKGAEVSPTVRLPRWSTTVSWMLTEDTRLPGQRRRIVLLTAKTVVKVLASVLVPWAKQRGLGDTSEGLACVTREEPFAAENCIFV